MPIATFPSNDVAAKLRERQPHQADIVYAFACAIADKLPTDRMVYSAFVLTAHTLVHDAKRGAAGVPTALLGFPRVLYACLMIETPALARRCLPAEQAELAVAMHAQVMAS